MDTSLVVAVPPTRRHWIKEEKIRISTKDRKYHQSPLLCKGVTNALLVGGIIVATTDKYERILQQSSYD